MHKQAAIEQIINDSTANSKSYPSMHKHTKNQPF